MKESPKTPAAAAQDGGADESMPVGQVLKQERLRQNKTLKEVAEATCIHLGTIEAIEEDHRSQLPAEVFVRGFLSIYAQYLGLSPQDILTRYGRKTTAEWVSPGGGSEKGSVLPPKTVPGAPGAGRRWALVVFGLAVAALLGFWGYRVFPSAIRRTTTTMNKYSPAPKNPPAGAKIKGTAGRQAATRPSRPTPTAEAPAPEEKTPPPQHKETPHADRAMQRKNQESAPPLTGTAPKKEASPPAPQVVPPSPASPVATTAEPAGTPAHAAAYVLKAQFTQTTWLRIQLDGGKPVEYLFQPGEHHTWKADTINLFLGNAGGVNLVLNGKPLPSPGSTGKTARLKFDASPTTPSPAQNAPSSAQNG